MTLVFATNNKHKLSEIRAILGDDINILSLADINCHADIPETADTLEGNALQKAQYVVDHFGMSCFADDTGLEVDALNGEPSIYSARYAGENHDSEANMTKLLKKLGQNLFEGIVKGEIIRERRGGEGFGYDPIFQPEGYSQTFAEMGSEAKNAISHRGRAVRKLVEYLTNKE